MRRFFLVPLALLLVLLAAACGGGGGSSSVSSDDVAVVNGQHVSRAALDTRMNGAACGYKLQKRPFPKAGSHEYQQLQQQIVQTLVERIELVQKAPSLNVKVTDKQVEDQLKSLKKQYFGGSEKKYRAELKKQCVTDAQVRDDVRANLLSNAIYKKLTAGATVTPTTVRGYYDAHRQVYTTPQTRVVSHILVKDKSLADRLYAQLKGGANFATLAKKYSTDPGSKANGGQLTITKGQTVPQFDKVAFELHTGQLSKPVHTQYGWHIIQALSAVKAAKQTPLASVEASIKQNILQTKKTDAMNKWVNSVKKDFAKKVTYQAGYQPAPTTTASTTGTTATTTTTG